jgi:glycosyltransferase involved in cell wall biosynthesis
MYNYAKAQLTIPFLMIKLSKNVDFWIFPISGEDLLPCVILSKIQRKPVIMVLSSSTELMTNHHKNPFTPIVVFFTKVNYFLATKIVLYSSALVSEWHLEKYRHKIHIAHRHFLDFTTFTITTPLSQRPPLIGYIGRLSGEKGIQHFAQALPAILSEQKDLRVLIGGDGELKEAIAGTLQEEGIADRVNLLGIITHDDISKYLNQLRLLVLPSYTEGLPNIMLEAMACGTPVLATQVGAIPDIIKEGETGFIMEDNSPMCIAENVIRVLNSPDLVWIAENGRRFVEENHTFEKTMERWKELLQRENIF